MDSDRHQDDVRRVNRPWIGVRFACCGIYQRIYLNRSKIAFRGWCPRCCGEVVVRVDPEGGDVRFFHAR